MWRGAVEKAATERQRRDLGLFVCSLLCAYLFDTFFKSGAVKIFRHLARKMKDGKEELVGRTGLSWSFSYLLLKFQVLVPRVSTLISHSRFFVTSSSSSSYILLCCAPLYPYVLTNKVCRFGTETPVPFLLDRQRTGVAVFKYSVRRHTESFCESLSQSYE